MAAVIQQTPARGDYHAATFPITTSHCAPFNVSTREPAAIEYWCRHFDTSPERLLEAVRRVGSNPDIVRLELRAFRAGWRRQNEKPARGRFPST